MRENVETFEYLESKKTEILTPAILVAHIWKSPHISKTNNSTSNRENELLFAPPFATLLDRW